MDVGQPRQDLKRMAARLREMFCCVNGWRVAALALAVLLVFALQSPSPSPATPELTHQLARMAGQVQELQQERSMPMLVLDRHRDSICFLYGIYSFRGPNGQVRRRMR